MAAPAANQGPGKTAVVTAADHPRRRRDRIRGRIGQLQPLAPPPLGRGRGLDRAPGHHLPLTSDRDHRGNPTLPRGRVFSCRRSGRSPPGCSVPWGPGRHARKQSSTLERRRDFWNDGMRRRFIPDRPAVGVRHRMTTSRSGRAGDSSPRPRPRSAPWSLAGFAGAAQAQDLAYGTIPTGYEDSYAGSADPRRLYRCAAHPLPPPDRTRAERLGLRHLRRPHGRGDPQRPGRHADGLRHRGAPTRRRACRAGPRPDPDARPRRGAGRRGAPSGPGPAAAVPGCGAGRRDGRWRPRSHGRGFAASADLAPEGGCAEGSSDRISQADLNLFVPVSRPEP